MTIKGYLLSFPERVARSVLGLGAGVAREVGEVAIPEGIRRGQLYQNLVDTTLRYLIERVGGVEGVYDAEDPLPEHFLARRTAGNAVEVLGFVAFRASPVWVLAALADLSGMGRHLIPEIADALKAEGLLEKDTEFTSMDQMLDGLERTSSRLAATMNTPPLDVAELRQEWKAIREEARGLKPLPSRDRIRHLWTLLETESERQGRSVFETSSLMAVSAARSLPDGVRWLGASTRVGAARTGQVLAAALLDHYKQTLSELGQVGYLAYARRQLRPYVHAAARQFSPKRRTLTQRLLSRSRRSLPVLALLLLGFGQAAAQPPKTFTRADTLRGSFTTPARAWWDVAFYDLQVAISPADSSIRGHNAITYRVLASPSPPEMQIDLMTPLEIDSVMQDGRSLPFRREGNAFFVSLTEPQETGELETVTVHYHGQPHPAEMPPWQGGFTWTADSLGRPWIVTTDQGMGASVWWPNKDTQADEPDSQRVALTLPDPILDVSNGRLRSTTPHPDRTTTYEWFVVNPINNYAITVGAGSYAHFSDTFEGEKGTLTLDYWPLDYHLEAARRQFTQVEPTLQCFEHWFGPYPWYEDGYKLIETPHPGMEHQSAVAYGNHYANGYRGRDPSGVGIGLKFDFIIVHETAHEWFGNNISTKDLADMWVHESFGNYAENLYVECQFGKEEGAAYVIGTRRGIDNDRPIIPPYGVNAQGSGDMYPKGGNMLHTIRQIVGDDEEWRSILRGLNETFWHQTVMGAQIEEYISQHAGRDLSKVFDQYLRTTQIPVLEYKIEGTTLSYRWADVVPGFDMPVEVEVTLTEDGFRVIHPTESWQTATLELANPKEFSVDPNYYVIARKVGGATP